MGNFESNSENDEVDEPMLTQAAGRIRKQSEKTRKSGVDPFSPWYNGQFIEDNDKLKHMVKNYVLKSKRDVYSAKNETLRYSDMLQNTITSHVFCILFR
ncbi:hypothetical protein HanRHA438_Chr04g0161291 [Helianthus annuus]|nr:hypothetical protein HanRHA438_Chr04g0161291 [Helianthus annuus]